MRKGRSSTLAFGVAALVTALVVGGCGPIRSTNTASTDDPSLLDHAGADVQSQSENPLLDLLKPLAVSPDGAYVAVGLDGVTLYDRSDRSVSRSARCQANRFMVARRT